eukprot:6479430-Amphidinium_carterae.2
MLGLVKGTPRTRGKFTLRRETQEPINRSSVRTVKKVDLFRSLAHVLGHWPVSFVALSFPANSWMCALLMSMAVH